MAGVVTVELLLVLVELLCLDDELDDVEVVGNPPLKRLS